MEKGFPAYSNFQGIVRCGRKCDENKGLDHFRGVSALLLRWQQACAVRRLEGPGTQERGAQNPFPRLLLLGVKQSALPP